jgi:hypothetical protein
MGTSVINFLLLLVAIVLFLPLSIINIFLVVFKGGNVSDYFKETAIDIDRFGNRNFRTLLNITLQESGYKFGDERETISSALGKNKRDGTLTKTGITLCSILDFLDNNHCIKSIKEL